MIRFKTLKHTGIFSEKREFLNLTVLNLFYSMNLYGGENSELIQF